MNKQKRVAIMYDFDDTLAPGNMQEYAFIPALNMSSKDFWTQTRTFGKKHNMDANLAYMYMMIQLAQQKNLNITYNEFKKQGATIKYFPGVENWFKRINAYGKKMGLEIEHYIISCGNTELLEGASIYNEFKRVYGCSFTYDDEGYPFWVSQLVNYTSKTQFIYRIRKNELDDFYDTAKINRYISDRSTLFPYSNMIYVGDGDTDIPSMKHIKTKGGHSICVYNEEKPSKLNIASKLFRDGRVNFIAPTNYEENSKIDNIIKDIFEKIVLDQKLSEYKN